jgi:hypothetical protein
MSATRRRSKFEKSMAKSALSKVQLIESLTSARDALTLDIGGHNPVIAGTKGDGTSCLL